MPVTSQCTSCVKGESCSNHHIWTPTSLNSTQDSSPAPSDRGESSSEGGVTPQLTVEDGEISGVQPDPFVPHKDRRATYYDSSHIPKVNTIKNPPIKFGIPTHLTEYDSISPSKVLDSNHKVKVTMGQVYKVTL